MRAPRIYVASPLPFSMAGRVFYYETLLPMLRDAGLEPLDPWTDPSDPIGKALRIQDPARRIAALQSADVAAGRYNNGLIDQADAMFAVLDGTDVDSGTSSEIGKGFERGIPVDGVRMDFRLSSDNAGTTVNLQVEYFIRQSAGGEIFSANDLPALGRAVAHMARVARGRVEREEIAAHPASVQARDRDGAVIGNPYTDPVDRPLGAEALAPAQAQTRVRRWMLRHSEVASAVVLGWDDRDRWTPHYWNVRSGRRVVSVDVTRNTVDGRAAGYVVALRAAHRTLLGRPAVDYVFTDTLDQARSVTQRSFADRPDIIRAAIYDIRERAPQPWARTAGPDESSWVPRTTFICADGRAAPLTAGRLPAVSWFDYSPMRTGKPVEVYLWSAGRPVRYSARTFLKRFWREQPSSVAPVALEQIELGSR